MCVINCEKKFYTLARRNMNTKHWVHKLIYFFVAITTVHTYGQNITISDSIYWQNLTKTIVSKDFSFTSFKFNGGIYPTASSAIPIYSKKVSIPTNHEINKIRLVRFESIPLTNEELAVAKSTNLRTRIDTFTLHGSIYSERKKDFFVLNFLPIILNKRTNALEKVTTFEVSIELSLKTVPSKGRTYAANSVLATGNWYKIKTFNEGVHILKKQDVIAMGLDPNTTDPAMISIFGNGGTPLPQKNATPRRDDLTESAVVVEGGGDGSFDDTDYVLFYTQSPVGWVFDKTAHQYNYNRNSYGDFSYYFITFDPAIGTKKRIQTAAAITAAATQTISKYTRFIAYEKERLNLTKSGSDWLGETFDYTTEYDFPFRISNIDLSSPLKVTVGAAANASANSSFNITIGGTTQSISLSGIPSNADQIKATENSQMFTFTPPASSFNINISYIKPTTLAIGWLNNIIIQAQCLLSQTESQLIIRSNGATINTDIFAYTVSNGATSKVWDITDINNIYQIPTTINGSDLSFKSLSDTIHEFVSFNGQNYFSPQFVGTIENQNLHAIPALNMVIIAHPDFVAAAEELKTFHENERGLSVQIVTPNQIYNEFGSGSPDVVAIRDFVKMCYDKNGPSVFKYLLLIGDASYDYRNILGLNQNFVPTFENEISTDDHTSFGSDDFFGLLDDSEGEGCTGLLDIGIGRFVVKTATEAQNMVDKTIRYCSKSDLAKNNTSQISNYGDWKNVISIIADDGNVNAHLSTAIDLSDIVETNYPNFNVEKIFLDAYTQVSNSGGQRYPEVEVAINERMRKSALLMTYVGHGGEVGWAHERILKISDILSWQNKFNQPIMFTATCEFTRFDDPARVSAGELVHLNTNGGAEALFTTSRVAWTNTNDFLAKNFFQNAFIQLGDNQYHSLGELILISKNLDPGSWSNLRNFILIGDPSITFAFPKYKVKTTAINQNSISTKSNQVNKENSRSIGLKDLHLKSPTDTLKALSLANIKGIVTDNSDVKLTNFNGEISVIVYDKPSTMRTLANKPEESIAVNFQYRKNIIFKGRAKVTNGDFDISFIVPKDIGYNYGLGKFSYYGKCDTADATGSFMDIVVGGYSDHPIIDNTPPTVKLFLNNENFANLGLTNENPTFIAQVSDSSGINIMGSSIGHDAVITIDNQSNKSIVINDYFETELNSYQKGTFNYPLSDLSEGKHTLTFKVWDILNNSSEKTLEFTVVKQAQVQLDHVLNYPNPFTTNTNFFFEHNQGESYLNTKIQIFTITGKLVKSITQSILMTGSRSDGIPWDGTDDYGDKLAKGVYLYKLSVKTGSGNYAEKIEKLVIL